MFDYHVHTIRSADCETPILASCEAAVRAGVTEIAFTDHVEYEPSDMCYGFYDYGLYMRDLLDARARYDGQLTILAGAEIGFNVRLMPEIEEFLSVHEFDFVIGSVHHSPDGVIIFPEYFDDHNMIEVMRVYLDQLRSAAEDRVVRHDRPSRPAQNGTRRLPPARTIPSLASRNCARCCRPSSIAACPSKSIRRASGRRRKPACRRHRSSASMPTWEERSSPLAPIPTCRRRSVPDWPQRLTCWNCAESITSSSFPPADADIRAHIVTSAYPDGELGDGGVERLRPAGWRQAFARSPARHVR